MFQLLLFVALFLCGNVQSQPVKQTIQWNNCIGKYNATSISPTCICYIRVLNNKIERWYLDGETYCVTQETPRLREHQINKSPKEFKEEIDRLERRFNTHYIPSWRIKEMQDMSSFEKFGKIN